MADEVHPEPLAIVVLPNHSGVQFAFSGPFSQVRDELNHIFHQFSGKPGSEALILREAIYLLVERCVDPAQATWQRMGDPKAPHPVISVSVDVSVNFTEAR